MYYCYINPTQWRKKQIYRQKHISKKCVGWIHRAAWRPRTKMISASRIGAISDSPNMSTSPTIPTGFSGPVPVRESRELWLKLSQSRSGDSTIASGTVSAGEFPGGLIGVHIGIVRDSVAIGDVIATTDAGGLIADRSRLGEQGTVRDSYWDINAIGLTTAEMQGSATAQNLALGFEEPGRLCPVTT